MQDMTTQIPLPDFSGSYFNGVHHEHSLTLPFWKAMRENRFTLQKCDNCGAFRWTPQWMCIQCHALEYTWTEVSGRGTVYSFTIIHRPPLPTFKAPYVLATVKLDEGPMMLTNIIRIDAHAVAIDMKVKVVFDKANDDITLYRFAPVQA